MRAFLTALTLFSLLSGSAHAMDPCEAFGFFRKNSADWRSDFRATMGHYQAKLDAAPNSSVSRYYERITNRILDCYSAREKKGEVWSGSPRSSAAPETGVSFYDDLSRELSAYPLFHAPTDPIFEAAERVVDKGVSPEDLKFVDPEAKGYAKIPSTGKKVVAESDAELSEVRAVFAKVYPKSRYDSDRALWKTLYAHVFEENVAKGATPLEARGLALSEVQDEARSRLAKLKTGIRDALGSKSLEWIFNRKDLASYLVDEKLFAAEVLKIEWEMFAEFPRTRIQGDEAPVLWAAWKNTLETETEKSGHRLRSAPVMREQILERLTGAVENTADPQPYQIAAFTKKRPGFLAVNELESYTKLELFRARSVQMPLSVQSYVEAAEKLAFPAARGRLCQVLLRVFRR